MYRLAIYDVGKISAGCLVRNTNQRLKRLFLGLFSIDTACCYLIVATSSVTLPRITERRKSSRLPPVLVLSALAPLLLRDVLAFLAVPGLLRVERDRALEMTLWPRPRDTEGPGLSYILRPPAFVPLLDAGPLAPAGVVAIASSSAAAAAAVTAVESDVPSIPGCCCGCLCSGLWSSIFLVVFRFFETPPLFDLLGAAEFFNDDVDFDLALLTLADGERTDNSELLTFFAVAFFDLPRAGAFADDSLSDLERTRVQRPVKDDAGLILAGLTDARPTDVAVAGLGLAGFAELTRARRIGDRERQE